MVKIEKLIFPTQPKIDWDFIWQQEGGLHPESSLPLKTGGVTIGPNFDIGQHTLAEIDALNLSPLIKAKLKKWAAYRLGKTRNAINDPTLAFEYEEIQKAMRAFKKAKLKQLRTKRKLALAKKQKAQTSFAQIEADQAKQELQKTKQALDHAQKENSFYFTITREELNALVQAIIQVKEPHVIETYNQAISHETKQSPQVDKIKTLKPFAALPASVQTIIASFLYNRHESVEKTGTPEEKAFWNAAVKQEVWTEVAALLKESHLDQEPLKTRREQEADYLIKKFVQEQNLPLNKISSSEIKSTLKTNQEEIKYWKTHLKIEVEKILPAAGISSFKFNS